jgi:hypothetical protein
VCGVRCAVVFDLAADAVGGVFVKGGEEICKYSFCG